jgi:DNA-binding IclR family transcriptional regulator
MPRSEPPRLALRVSRGLALLELLAFEPRTAPASAAALGFDPRTARRLLRSLAADRWVQAAADRRWEPTLRLAALAAQLLERSPLVRAAGPAVRAAAEAAGAPVELAVPSYDCALTVLRAEAAELVPLRRLEPATRCAAGRVLLAHRPQWRASVAGSADPALADRLERIRRDGVDAGDAGDAGDTTPTLAVPVSVAGDVIAALACEPAAAHVAAPLDAVAVAAPAAAHVAALRDAAAAIAAALS